MYSLLRSVLAFTLLFFCLSVGRVSAVDDLAQESQYKAYLVSGPEPIIPEVALRKGWGGLIKCQLKINPKTGVVDEVKVLHHTHYPKLDAIVVMNFFNNWRFKPNTLTTVTFSWNVGILGRSRDYHSGMY